MKIKVLVNESLMEKMVSKAVQELSSDVEFVKGETLSIKIDSGKEEKNEDKYPTVLRAFTKKATSERSTERNKISPTVKEGMQSILIESFLAPSETHGWELTNPNCDPEPLLEFILKRKPWMDALDHLMSAFPGAEIFEDHIRVKEFNLFFGPTEMEVIMMKDNKFYGIHDLSDTSKLKSAMKGKMVDLTYDDVFRENPNMKAGPDPFAPFEYFYGSPLSDEHRFSEEVVQRVETMDYQFSIGKYPALQHQWIMVSGENPSVVKGSFIPVNNVSWDQIIKWFELLHKKTGVLCRPPQDKEWECAVRAGTSLSRYEVVGYEGISGDIDKIAWYDGNSQQSIHPVGLLEPNKWNFYDMLGNVWEWCDDVDDK